MRILHITPTLYPAVGGIETVVRDLLRELRQRGVTADALHIAPGLARRREVLDGSVVWRVPLLPHRLLGFAPIRRIVAGYDLLHVHDPQLMAISANVLLQGGRLPRVLSTHGGYGHTGQYGRSKAAHWRWAAGPLLRRYDRVLASSPADYERFRTAAGNVRLVPNGVSLGRGFTRGSGQPPDPLRWIYWGRLSRNKRLDLLVDLVARLRARGLAVDLLIAGRDFDGLAPALRRQIERLSLAGQVHLRGELSDPELQGEIAGRGVFATASEHEGFGLSVVEAMAAGLIVVCRDMAPLSGFVAQGGSGRLLRFDGGEADLALLEGLLRGSPGELARMSAQGRAAAALHGWESVIGQYLAVYAELVGRPPGRGAG